MAAQAKRSAAPAFYCHMRVFQHRLFCSSLVLFSLMALSESSVTRINSTSVVSGPLVPHLGLSCCLDAPFRVYVLECVHHLGGSAPALYVGIERADDVGSRIHTHFQGQGAHFTKVNKPSCVQLIWQATSRAVEAYVFYALLQGSRI